MNQDIQGGCMCGAVRYSATAKPANSMVCHCQSCRRSAASPVVAWVTFAKAEFRFTRGTPHGVRVLGQGEAALLRRLRLAAHLRASRHARLRRRHDLQPGCALGISAHASFVAQRRHRLGEIRRWPADVPAVAIWRSFLSSRPRGSRCAASNSTTRHSSCDCSTSRRSSRTSAIAACAPSKTRIAICARGRWRCTKNTASDCGTSRAIRTALPSECAACSSATILPDVDMGYAFLPEFWGHGLCLRGGRVPRCVMAHGNSASNASSAWFPQGNNASIRVLEKLGMSFERMYRDASRRARGAAVRPHPVRRILAARDLVADDLADLRAVVDVQFHRRDRTAGRRRRRRSSRCAPSPGRRGLCPSSNRCRCSS